MVAEKRFSKQNFAEDKEMMMLGLSYRGMHITFFDEKKLAVWKYQRNRYSSQSDVLVLRDA